MHRITKVLYSGAIACSIVAGGVTSASAVGTGNEGCTPGYFKNHPGVWEEYKPTDTLASVFPDADLGQYGQTTLLQALSFGGGSDLDGAKRILLRAAVAAVLNAADDDLGYPLQRFSGTGGGIINRVEAAINSDDRATILKLASTLDKANNLGCPLGRDGERNV
jgi:hypothetical protein